MRICLIAYHKNAENIYPAQWIEQFKQSVLNQTYREFDVKEVEYGGGNFRIFENSDFESKEFVNFVHAMNYLLDKCFSEGYDYVLNSNVDDFFSDDRIEKQLAYMQQGHDLISSNFSLIRDGQPIHTHRFENVDIQRELSLNNNVICHPVVAYSKRFWAGNRYNPDAIPFEDLNLWKEAINNGYRFVILPDVLCYHRLHSNSVCSNENNR